jgi:hypothetical protein
VKTTHWVSAWAFAFILSKGAQESGNALTGKSRHICHSHRDDAPRYQAATNEGVETRME